MKYLIAFLMCLCSTTYAQNKPWTDSEKQLFAAHTVLVMADWAQTRQIAKQPGIYYEANPVLNKIIGKNPSVETVDLTMLTMIVGSYYLADYSDNREKVMFYWSIFRAGAVVHNLNIGLKIKF